MFKGIPFGYAISLKLILGIIIGAFLHVYIGFTDAWALAVGFIITFFGSAAKAVGKLIWTIVTYTFHVLAEIIKAFFKMLGKLIDSQKKKKK